MPLNLSASCTREVPHLSVVAVSRNDDHGGDMRNRMQHFVNGFIAQCRKHGLAAELILVEWNPPANRPPLEDSLEWPADFGPAQVRIVTVPPNIHARFPHSTRLPLFQMIGKNVGIRRARGRYVLATNVDILIDDATIVYLRDRLAPRMLLRVDRCDVPHDLATDVSFDQVLAECRARCFQINTRFGVFGLASRRILDRSDTLESKLLALYSEIRLFGLFSTIGRISDQNFHAVLQKTLTLGVSMIHYVLAGPALLRKLGRILYGVIDGKARTLAWRLTLPRLIRAMLFTVRFSQSKIATAGRMIAKARRFMGLSRRIRWRSPAMRRLARSQHLHTWACGDFTLLAREDWCHLRGYPEWPIFSWHIDSVFLFAANAHDIRQKALGGKYRVYHIDHSKGSGWSLAGELQLFARLDSDGIPYLGNEDVSRIQTEFAESPITAITNGVDWGLIDFVLPEREIMPGNSSNRVFLPAAS